MYQNELAGKRILVTGGSGFIASHLCRRLIGLGADLYITTKYNSLMDNIRLASFWDTITILEADLRNPDSLAQLQAIKPQIVYHFAAYNHVGDSFLHVSEAIDSNAKGTANLMEAWKGYERFVYISTSEVYGYQETVPFTETMIPQPMSPYSVGKYSGELFARMSYRSRNLPVVVLRPFNAFGPYQSPRAVIPELIMKCLRGVPLETTEGKQTREFNFVENLVDGFIQAAIIEDAVGQIINLGSGREVPIRELVTKIHEYTASKSELRLGALPYRPGEIWRMYADNAKADKILGWTPQVSFEDGLKRTVEWFRRYLDVLGSPDSPVAKLGQ